MSDKKFPWGCVLGGCALVVVAGIGLLVGLGFWSVKRAEQFEEDLKKPEKQQAKVERILGTDSLPEGLYPVLGMSIPFLFDLALLSETPPVAGEPGEMGDQGLIYFSVLTRGKQRQEMEELFAGKRSSARMLREANIDVDIDVDEVLGHGEVAGENQEIRWIAYRGKIEVHKSLITMLLVTCPTPDSRLRLGIWFSPDPDPALPVSELDLSSTVVDQAAIEQLTAHFQLCKES